MDITRTVPHLLPCRPSFPLRRILEDGDEPVDLAGRIQLVGVHALFAGKHKFVAPGKVGLLACFDLMLKLFRRFAEVRKEPSLLLVLNQLAEKFLVPFSDHVFVFFFRHLIFTLRNFCLLLLFRVESKQRDVDESVDYAISRGKSVRSLDNIGRAAHAPSCNEIIADLNACDEIVCGGYQFHARDRRGIGEGVDLHVREETSLSPPQPQQRGCPCSQRVPADYQLVARMSIKCLLHESEALLVHVRCCCPDPRMQGNHLVRVCLLQLHVRASEIAEPVGVVLRPADDEDNLFLLFLLQNEPSR
mmetsp:Transcript_22854/g.51504  ORF Transcript_22854/g.51504 Transcript_22854/m.51504 type:complete len:303 (-) Transcript_22854:993-1901(-)